MIKKVCDRCKKEFYPPQPWQNCVLPYYRIIKTIDFPLGLIEVDLCDDCIKEFEEWMKNET